MSESKERQLIIFCIEPEQFVLDITPLVQIISYKKPTPVPRSPQFVEGIIILRNQVIPIINMKTRLFPGVEEADLKHKVLIMRVRDQVIGLKVDSVQRIITVSDKDILPPPPQFEGVDTSFLKGVVRYQDTVYLYMGAERVLTPGEIEQLRTNKHLQNARRGESDE